MAIGIPIRPEADEADAETGIAPELVREVGQGEEERPLLVGMGIVFCWEMEEEVKDEGMKA
jgi:hypothetical protein